MWGAITVIWSVKGIWLDREQSQILFFFQIDLFPHEVAKCFELPANISTMEFRGYLSNIQYSHDILGMLWYRTLLSVLDHSTYITMVAQNTLRTFGIKIVIWSIQDICFFDSSVIFLKGWISFTRAQRVLNYHKDQNSWYFYYTSTMAHMVGASVAKKMLIRV